MLCHTDHTNIFFLPCVWRCESLKEFHKRNTYRKFHKCTVSHLCAICYEFRDLLLFLIPCHTEHKGNDVSHNSTNHCGPSICAVLTRICICKFFHKFHICVPNFVDPIAEDCRPSSRRWDHNGTNDCVPSSWKNDNNKFTTHFLSNL